MRIDLERALEAIAATAQSAAAPVPTDRLVSRLRRRRAVRTAGGSVAALVLVAAVGLAAAQAGGADGVTAPAAPEPTTQTQDGRDPRLDPEVAEALGEADAQREAIVERMDEAGRVTEVERRRDATVLAEILAAAPAGRFPGCGALVPTTDESPLTLTVEVDPGPYEGGDVVVGRTTLHAADAPVTVETSAPYLVYVRDGVVVGSDLLGAVFATTATDLARGEAITDSSTGRLRLCPAFAGEALPLPAGTYQVFAAVEAIVREARPGTGEAAAPPTATSILSNPVDVVVD